MATTQANLNTTAHQLVPLQLSGNTTEQQNRQLQEFLGEAVQQAYRAAIEQLDRHSAQSVLEMNTKLKREVTFDRVPLFDYDIGGIEFSIFYEDRARNLWGTPTAFLYKMV